MVSSVNPRAKFAGTCLSVLKILLITAGIPVVQ